MLGDSRLLHRSYYVRTAFRFTFYVTVSVVGVFPTIACISTRFAPAVMKAKCTAIYFLTEINNPHLCQAHHPTRCVISHIRHYVKCESELQTKTNVEFY